MKPVFACKHVEKGPGARWRIKIELQAAVKAHCIIQVYKAYERILLVITQAAVPRFEPGEFTLCVSSHCRSLAEPSLILPQLDAWAGNMVGSWMFWFSFACCP